MCQTHGVRKVKGRYCCDIITFCRNTFLSVIGGGKQQRGGDSSFWQKSERETEINFCTNSHLLFCLHSYDECVGPGSAQIYIPTDDPPPYSLLDPCQGRAAPEEQQPNDTRSAPSPYFGETSGSAAWFSPSHYPLGLQAQEHIASISFPLEAAPPYESVLAEQGQPLPLMPCDLYKHQTERGGDGNPRQQGANQIL